jgi:ribose 1,5-bisphosphokinase PhnN
MKGGGHFREGVMSIATKEREWADRARRYVKAELKRVEVSYAELARRLKEHGLEETEASITAKLNRGTFAATFFLATMKAIGRQTVNLEEL